MQMITKDIGLARVSADTPRFIISSTAVDKAGDQLTAKALAKVAAAGKPIVALLHHDRTKVAGLWSGLSFDDATGRLEADLTPVEGAPAGKEAKSLLDAGVPLSASVGFYGRGMPNEFGGTTYDSITLAETSLVVSPANPEAVRVKSADDETAELRLQVAVALALGDEQ